MTTRERTNAIRAKNNTPLVDRYSRPIDYLRISLTQNCNHSCFFCHREGESGKGKEMTPEAIENLVRIANQRGIKRIKLTGGEALVRDDILEIIHRISPLTDDLSLTTNGSKLEDLALVLKESGLNRVNISLHTLKPALHEIITGRNDLEDVMRGIESAVRVGLTPVKINMAVLREINVDEIPDMMSYASRVGAILQLIELQLLPGDNEWERYWFNLSNIEDELRRKAIHVEQRLLHDRKQYTIPIAGTNVTVEVVKPNHNQSFCLRCTRLRVTSDGKLKPCLLKKDNLVEVYSILGNNSPEYLVNEALDKAVSLREPFWNGDEE